MSFLNMFFIGLSVVMGFCVGCVATMGYKVAFYENNELRKLRSEIAELRCRHEKEPDLQNNEM